MTSEKENLRKVSTFEKTSEEGKKLFCLEFQSDSTFVRGKRAKKKRKKKRSTIDLSSNASKNARDIRVHFKTRSTVFVGPPKDDDAFVVKRSIASTSTLFPPLLLLRC